MAARQPRYSKEEFARRGTELYEQKIRPLVEAGNHGRLVMVDIETGEYELCDDSDSVEAARKMIARKPDVQVMCFRVGFPAVTRIGGAWPTGTA
jgi:hypothetical protein